MFGFGTPSTDLRAAAEALDGPFVSALVESAGRAGTVVVAAPSSLPPVHACTTRCDRRRQRRARRYRKLHLYDALGWRSPIASNPAKPGRTTSSSSRSPTSTSGHDLLRLRFPEMARVLCDRGADVLCVPAAWVAGRTRPRSGVTSAGRVRSRTRAMWWPARSPRPSSPAAPWWSTRSASPSPPSGADVGAHALGEASAEKLAEVRAALPLLASRRFDVVPR